MSIPSRQIGWSNESNLLWQISKQLEQLIGVTSKAIPTTTTTSTSTSTTTSTTTAAPLPLRMLFSDITAVDTIVGDSSNVSDWNSYFDLPTYGGLFTSVLVTGDEVELYGGSNIIIKESLFDQADELGTYLLEVDDQAECIIEVRYDGFGYDNNNGCFNLTYVNLPKVTIAGDYAFEYVGASAASPLVINLPLLITAGFDCFENCETLQTLSLPALRTANNFCFLNCYGLTSVNLPVLNSVGVSVFTNCNLLTTISLPSLTIGASSFLQQCYSLTTISLPSCTNLGGSVINNNVFNLIVENTITLTVPASRMTCNAGSPDGDIQYLQANNTVTIVTV